MYFSCFIALATSSTTVFNRCSESRYPSFIPDLGRKAFSLSQLSVVWVVVFCRCFLLDWVYFFTFLLFWEFFFFNDHCNPKTLLRSTLFFFKLWVYLYIYLFIYLWLCWVFVSFRGLSLVAASGGHSSSQCAGLSLSRPLLLWSTGSRRAGSVVVEHRPSCSAACGIFPDQGSNPCPLHWQADSQPLCHQGSPLRVF